MFVTPLKEPESKENEEKPSVKKHQGRRVTKEVDVHEITDVKCFIFPPI